MKNNLILYSPQAPQPQNIKTVRPLSPSRIAIPQNGPSTKIKFNLIFFVFKA